MKISFRRSVFVVALALLMLGVAVTAEQRAMRRMMGAPPILSSNPIAAPRQPCGSTNLPNDCWSVAGVEGGIPTRTRCPTG